MGYTVVKNLGIFTAMTVVIAIIMGISGMMGDGLNILVLLGGGLAFSCVLWLPFRLFWSTLFSDGLLMAILVVVFGVGFEAFIYIVLGALFGDMAANILIVLLFIATFFLL